MIRRFLGNACRIVDCAPDETPCPTLRRSVLYYGHWDGNEEILRIASVLFAISASTFPKIAEPVPKPSLFRPIPVLGDEAVSVIETIVYFALTENKLPCSHNRPLLKFAQAYLISSTIVSLRDPSARKRRGGRTLPHLMIEIALALTQSPPRKYLPRNSSRRANSSSSSSLLPIHSASAMSSADASLLCNALSISERICLCGSQKIPR